MAPSPSHTQPAWTSTTREARPVDDVLPPDLAIPILIVCRCSRPLELDLHRGDADRRSGIQGHQHGRRIAAGLFGATLLLILFRRRYPRWWFDFAREFTRFGPGWRLPGSAQRSVSLHRRRADGTSRDRLPDVETDLNRWLPLVKWFLAIPHYIVLAFLAIGAFFAVVIAWFAILFTGRIRGALRLRGRGRPVGLRCRRT